MKFILRSFAGDNLLRFLTFKLGRKPICILTFWSWKKITIIFISKSIYIYFEFIIKTWKTATVTLTFFISSAISKAFFALLVFKQPICTNTWLAIKNVRTWQKRVYSHLARNGIGSSSVKNFNRTVKETDYT